MSVGAGHELVERWIATWTYARGLDTTTVGGWPLIRVGSPTRETELVCSDPGASAFAALLHHLAGDPRAMLTVIARDIGPYLAVALPPGIRVDRDDETLMATAFTPLEAPPLDPEFTTRWDIEDHRTRYAVESGERVAAEATIGIRGPEATFDAVETTPAFQRRGLGRHVMATLTAYALESGARRGVLAASAQGRLLYESLGWEPAYQMLSLLGAAAEY